MAQRREAASEAINGAVCEHRRTERRRAMDVEATLMELRAACAAVCDERGFDDPQRAADLFEALDGWLRNGGFPPADWRLV